MKAPSGSGRSGVEIRPDLEYLRWLITHIKHRQTSTNTGRTQSQTQENIFIESELQSNTLDSDSGMSGVQDPSFVETDGKD